MRWQHEVALPPESLVWRSSWLRFRGGAAVRPRTQHAQRRLAAILAADVAGYSRLMGADEDRTLARLKAHRRELFGPLISEHRGHIIQTTGDGLLIEFASAVEAVRCAVEMQRGMVDRNANLPESQHLLFRMGINLGDIIEDDGDLFGDGVNVAARLERLSEPGGLCIARSVRDQIRDKLPYPFEDKGEHQVKNIARPVRVFALRPSKITQTEAHAVQPASVLWGRGRSVLLVCAGLMVITGLGIGGGLWSWTASRVDNLSTRLSSQSDPAEPTSTPGPSIMLLPLANVSPDAEENLVPDGITEDLSRDFEPDDFAEAITDDLTTGLARIPGLLVIARNTAVTYKGKAVDVRQVGRDVGVRFVLEGTLRRSGDQVRLIAQLSDARTGARLWAERTDGTLQQAGALDHQITSRVERT